jgi:hypothetical protein
MKSHQERMHMEINKQIAKALLNKSFAEAKEFVFKSLYAKASLALDEARFVVANSVFNEAAKTTGVPAGASEDKFTAARAEIKKAGHKAKLGKGVPAGSMKEEAELDEMAQTADRARQMRKIIKTRTATAAKHADDAREVDFYGQDNSREAARAAQSDRLLAQAKNRNAREKASKKTYGAGGKVVKEEVDQLDEVSPPGMEKMTGSKKTKASFTKQYGKRGKEVMYATAWKLHNKKAKD